MKKSEKSLFVFSPDGYPGYKAIALFLTFCSNSKRLKKSEAISCAQHTLLSCLGVIRSHSFSLLINQIY